MHNKGKSRKRERKIADELGGRTTPGSGSTWSQKSDVYNEHFRIEDKFTDKNSYSIHIDLLKKIEKEALGTNKVPIFKFGFPKIGTEYVVIDVVYSNIEYQSEYTMNISGKSKSLHANYLVSAYTSTDEDAFIKLNFDKYKKSYYVFMWDWFLENTENFLAL